MGKCKQTLRWGLLLWKRLYKKVSFLLLLLLIPILVFGYAATTQEESGLLTVALASEASPVEPLTRSVWETLMQSDVVRYICCDSPEQAQKLVEQDRADVAWIFMEDLETRIYEFAADRTRKNAFVTIVEPKDRTLLKLAREILSGVMFSYCSEAVYLNHIRQNVPELADVTDEALLESYRNLEMDDSLFAFTDIHGNVTGQIAENTHYLLTPVRGMLAVLMILAALATAMYYTRDLTVGTFAWIPQRRLWVVELGYQMLTAVNVSAVSLLSLWLAGQLGQPGREVAVVLLYSLCVSGFGMLVRQLCGGIRGLAMVTPLLIVAMLAVCPVFLDLGATRMLQLMLPPTYYIHGVFSWEYFGYMALYTGVCLALCLLLNRLCHHK